MQTRKEFYCVAFFFLFSAVALWMLLNRKPTAITKCKPRLHAKHGWAKHCCWNYFRCSITTNQLQIMCQRLQACFWKKCKAIHNKVVHWQHEKWFLFRYGLTNFMCILSWLQHYMNVCKVQKRRKMRDSLKSSCCSGFSISFAWIVRQSGTIVLCCDS